MLVTVDQSTKQLIRLYGFEQILNDAGLRKDEVLQILDDLGYINLESYQDAE